MFVQTWPLVVDEGKRIRITFLNFDIHTFDFECDFCDCDFDWLEIENVKYCGEMGTSSEIPTPFTIITNSNSVNVRFRSDNFDNGLPGFLAIWSSSQYNIPTGCNNCDFPFKFGDTTFDTCIIVQDVDTLPWCSPGVLSPPINEGIHILPLIKVTCSDSDSSCPSSPSQTVISSPDYPLNYPNNADQVK